MDDDMADLLRPITQVEMVEDNPDMDKELKKMLIRFMNGLGFTWIVDIAWRDGKVLLARLCDDGETLLWRPIEVEEQSFTDLFSGSIKRLASKKNI